MLIITHLTEVASTNDWIAERAASLADESWVRADRQKAGRGRRGRVWASDTGNLFASVWCRPQALEGPSQQLSFVASLALDVALQFYVPAERLSLKWPNDVLLDGVKCAGILLEGQPGGTIIGIGVNLAHHPQATERPATSLPAAGIASPALAEFAERLATALSAIRQIWRDGGFDPIRTLWLSRAAGKGAQLEARLGTETVIGRFEDLAADGALLLRLHSGAVRAIHAGEVFGL